VNRRLHRWHSGLLAALFALAAQFLIGAAAPEPNMRPTPEQQLSVLLADRGVICHGDVGGGGEQAPHHHAIDCMLCPYCAVVATAAVLRGGDPTLPIPRAGPIAVARAASQSITLPPSPKLAAG
jgi:hypothetical protein